MATPAKMRLRSDKHLGNITKRGRVSQPAKVRATIYTYIYPYRDNCIKWVILLLVWVVYIMQEEKGYSVGPLLLGFLVFVLVGSSLIQILQMAKSSK